MVYLTLSDITDNIAIIKVNKSYKAGMTAIELYDITRGCWKRRIDSVSIADYALSVAFGEVVEVYKIFKWHRAEDEHRKTIPYNEKESGRIVFSGEIASDNIRAKYIGKYVNKLYKQGDVGPVKIILNQKAIEALNDSYSDEEKESHAYSIDIKALENIAKEKSTYSLEKIESTVTQVKRDPYISTFAKRKANGICRLCLKEAPFKKENGEPYLECHHIEWLSAGGADSIENTVALCPNCHRKMHVLNLKEDVEYLKKKAIS